MGRPKSINKEVVRKLEVAFENGLSVTEACLSSGISRDTYYRYLHVDKEFSYKMRRSQASLLSKAKANIAKAVHKGDFAASKWFIEHEDTTISDPGSFQYQKLRLPVWIDDEGTLEQSRDFLIELMDIVIVDSDKFDNLENPSKELIVEYTEAETEEKYRLAVQYLSRHEELDFFTLLNLNSVLHLNREKPEYMRYTIAD